MRTFMLAATMALSLMFAAPAVQAGDQVNYRSISNQGFGDVAALLKSMTPEQRAQVMAQARAHLKELRSMTPQQREALVKQLKHMTATLKLDQIDPNKLDYSDTTGITAITQAKAAAAQ